MQKPWTIYIKPLKAQNDKLERACYNTILKKTLQKYKNKTQNFSYIYEI
jgi:hypothetical protein